MVRRSIRTVLEGTILVFAMIGVAQLSYWTLDREEPLVIHSRIIKDLRIAPGGQLKYVTNFTRHKFCETQVRRWIEDSGGRVYQLTTLDFAMATTSLDVRQSSEAVIDIPVVVPDGVAYSVFQSRWICNPFHKYVWPIYGPVTRIAFIADRSLMSADAILRILDENPALKEAVEEEIRE